MFWYIFVEKMAKNDIKKCTIIGYFTYIRFLYVGDVFYKMYTLFCYYII